MHLPRTEFLSKIYLIFFRKGDYCRYKAEFSSADEREDAAAKSLEAYKKANERATDKLKTTHPIRLGLSLNFSVFYYEIQNNPQEACRIAKKVIKLI